MKISHGQPHGSCFKKMLFVPLITIINIA